MKTRLLIIIGITIATIITVSVVSLQYFDTQKYSKENPYGFSAKVFYTKDFLPLCPVPNACQTHLQLKIWSNIPAILQGYKICNGFSCLEQDHVEYRTTNYGTIALFDGNKWNAGDKVSIKVQVITQYKDDETHPEPQTFYIDLGESEIVDVWHAEPEMPKTNNAEMESMIELFQNKYHTSQITYTGPKTILNATNVWGETVSLDIQSPDGKVIATLTCNHMDWRNQEVITENVLDYLQNKNCFTPTLEETRNEN